MQTTALQIGGHRYEGKRMKDEKTLRTMLVALVLIVPVTLIILAGGAPAAYEEAQVIDGSNPEAGDDLTEFHLMEVPEGFIGITVFEDLMAINEDETSLNGNYILMNDITFSDENNDVFVPIGRGYNSFTGTFNGNGYVIKGMNIERNDTSHVGLFGRTDGAEIYGLSVKESTITLSGALFVGNIVGYAMDSVIRDCYNDGDIIVNTTSRYGEAYTGGIVGTSYRTSIENCRNAGNITVTSAVNNYAEICSGGIAGLAYYTSIENCRNTGTISSDASFSYNENVSTGGIAGYAYITVIDDCHNAGPVDSILKGTNPYASTGGISGFGLIEMTIRDSSNTAPVTAVMEAGKPGDGYSAANMMVGGIIGNVYGEMVMERSRNTAPVTGTSVSYGEYALSYSSAGGLIGFLGGSLMMKECYNAGEVRMTSTASAYVDPIKWNIADSASYSSATAGGVIGNLMDPAIIRDCYNTGDIAAETTATAYGKYSSAYEEANAGGIVGHMENSSTVLVENCYSAGDTTVSAEGSRDHVYTGGIVGSTDRSTLVITHCYFVGTSGDTLCGNVQDTEVVNDIASGDKASGVKSEDQMKKLLEDILEEGSVYYTGEGGWDFHDVWTVIEGKNSGYPMLISVLDLDMYADASSADDVSADGSFGPQHPVRTDGMSHDMILWALFTVTITLLGLIVTLYGYRIRE